ncbi:MAG: ABC transporter substrate-binding protein [Gammaproteobacteria bacterium]|nr:ABC transporter substrate-binding protein [Gammaproteobacteria bacterium]
MTRQAAAMLTGLVFSMTMGLSAIADDTEETPVKVVKSTISRILKTLQDDALSGDQTREQVAAIASERINYAGMSQRILATNWARLSEDQQARFIGAFRGILVETYWQRMKNYSDEKVIYFTSSLNTPDFATVDTVIESRQVEIPVTYRLKKTNERWMAYDILIEGRSMVQTYRLQAAQLFKRGGAEALMEAVEGGDFGSSGS